MPIMRFGKSCTRNRNKVKERKMNITNKIQRPLIPTRGSRPDLGFAQSAQVSSGARIFPCAKSKSDPVHRTATADEILGSPITLKEELELFLKALEELPVPPSNLVIDDAEALDPDDPFGFLSGKSSWYENHKALEWEPQWGGLKPSRYPEVHKRILEVERLNKPEKNLRKRADSLKKISSIRDEVSKELMSQ